MGRKNSKRQFVFDADYLPSSQFDAELNTSSVFVDEWADQLAIIESSRQESEAVDDKIQLITKAEEKIKEAEVKRDLINLYNLRYTFARDIYTGNPLQGIDFIDWCYANGLIISMPKMDDPFTVGVWVTVLPTLWSKFKTQVKRSYLMLMECQKIGIPVVICGNPEIVTTLYTPTRINKSCKCLWQSILDKLI